MLTSADTMRVTFDANCGLLPAAYPGEMPPIPRAGIVRVPGARYGGRARRRPRLHCHGPERRPVTDGSAVSKEERTWTQQN